VRGLKLPQRLFLIPDAIGLALFTIAGTQIALQWHAPWLVASLLGVITGVVGGVLRDVLCNEVPLFVRGELYASAAWAGALALVGLQELGFRRLSRPGPAWAWCSQPACWRWLSASPCRPTANGNRPDMNFLAHALLAGTSRH
jgi:hypothetical protein